MKKAKIRVHVTFRHDGDPLACMLSKTFDSIKEAKKQIKWDASCFLYAHGLIHAKGAKQSAKWIDKKNADYYKVTAKDGAICYYQYFVFPL